MAPAPDAVVAFEPLDERYCRLTLAAPVAPGEEGLFDSPAGAGARPLAQALFGVPGVGAVAVRGDHVTVAKADGGPWESLEARLRHAVAVGLGAAPPGAGGAPLSDDETFERVERLLREEINPAVAAHGGAIELLDVCQGTVVVRMKGGCQGCGMATATLRQGVEVRLRQVVPGFAGLRDITDHAAGTNPYFARG